MDRVEQGNVFDMFSKRKQQTVSRDEEKFEYFAVGTLDSEEPKGSEEFIILQREPGRGNEMIRYVDILSVVCPVHQLLSMQCEQGIFHLEGQYLDVILYHIQNRKLQFLQQYVPEWHYPPREEEPVIHRITRDPEYVSDEELAEMQRSS